LKNYQKSKFYFMRGVFIFLIVLFSSTLFSQQAEYNVLNTSINSEFAELGASFLYGNTIIYASSKKSDEDKSFKKDRRRNNSQGHLELYKGIVTENGDIIENGRFSNEIKNKYFEADISFTPDLKTVYFTWNNYYSAETKEDIEKWNTLRIVKASVTDNFLIGNISFLPINSSSYSVRNPIVSNDGKKLFFVSDMPGGYGENDIYYIDIFLDGTYGKPINLGPAINSKNSELYPSIDSNHNLYFSSVGKDRKNGLDIFKSEFKNGNYQKAIALPEPINSEFDDFGFVVNNTTNSGFFTSNRTGSLGDVDIYAFTTNKKECIQSLTFNFINQNTKKQLTQVSGTLTVNNKTIESFNFKEEIQFKTKLKCNTNYKVTAFKENFLPLETTFSTSNTFDTSLNKTFSLIPIDCTQNIELIITSANQNQVIDNATIQLISNGNIIDSKNYTIGKTIAFQINCNSSYEIISTADNFESSKITFSSNGNYNAKTIQQIILIPKQCNQVIAGTITTNNNVPLTGNVSLYLNGKIIEKKTADKFRFNVNCNSAYKIIVEANNYDPAQITVSTDNTYTKVTDVIALLIPKACNQIIEGYVVNKNSNIQPKNTTVSLFLDGTLKESKNVSNNNLYNFSVNCNSNYMIIAEAENFETNQIEFSTTAEYNIKTQKDIALIPKLCNQIVSGIVKSDSDVYPLKNVVVSLFSNGILKEKQLVNDFYTFAIECNKNYTVVAEASNYETRKLEFSTNNNNKTTVEKNISLSPKLCYQNIELIVLNSESNFRIKDVTISLYLENEKIDTKNIITNNSLTFNLKCNSNYKIIAEADNFETNQIEFSTNAEYNIKTQKNITLIPKLCNQIVSGIVKSNSDAYPLKNVVVSLFSNGLLKDKQLVNDFYTFTIDCERNYTVVAEASNFDTAKVEFLTNANTISILEKNISLSPKLCNQNLELIVLNSESNFRINNAKISLYLENELVDTKNIITDNSLIFNLKCNSNYKIIAESENFESNEVSFKTDATFNSSAKKSIILIPKPCNQQLLVSIVNKENNEPLFGSILTVFRNNKIIETLKLEDKNSINLNLECKSEYNLKIQLDKFDTQAISFQTSNIYNDSLAKTIILTPSIEFVNVSGEKFINTNTIYFDLDTDKIRTDAAIEINKVIAYLIKFPNAKVDVKSHTDSRAPDNYNLELSNKRANSVINYIISNGISASRVSGKGYGETQLLNNCANGVKCTELEHQINRRTEFLIIE